jgi:DNA mismatch endonuclease (patch repair protein)
MLCINKYLLCDLKERCLLDNLTKEQRHKNMCRIRSKDTAIEISLRKTLWRTGYRYRKNYKALPGTPDIVLIKYRIVIFCDSEFWHGKDWEVLKPRIEKGPNKDYWVKKIARNRERDDEVNKKLLSMGWTVIRLWGKDILNDPEMCIRVIKESIADTFFNDIQNI